VRTVVPGAAGADDPRRPDGVALIDELVRQGARRMLADALRAEVDAYIAQFTGERDEHGRRLVVRNGTHQPREVLTSAGAVEVTAPRVNVQQVLRTHELLVTPTLACLPVDNADDGNTVGPSRVDGSRSIR
jgi:Transposase, Mutator family